MHSKGTFGPKLKYVHITIANLQKWEAKQVTGDVLPEIQGPDNPTCQRLPISSKRKVKMGWEMQEREKRW